MNKKVAVAVRYLTYPLLQSRKAIIKALVLFFENPVIVGEQLFGEVCQESYYHLRALEREGIVVVEEYV